MDLGGRFRRRDLFSPLDLEEEAAPDERHDEMEEAVEDAEAEVVGKPPPFVDKRFEHGQQYCVCKAERVEPCYGLLKVRPCRTREAWVWKTVSNAPIDRLCSQVLYNSPPPKKKLLPVRCRNLPQIPVQWTVPP